MKARLTRRRVLWVLATCVAVVIVGYSSSATSLNQCNDATTPWLLQQAPAGWTATRHHADPARLFLPLVATVQYEKHFCVAPQEYSYEWGPAATRRCSARSSRWAQPRAAQGTLPTELEAASGRRWPHRANYS